MRHSARARTYVAFACAALLTATPATALAGGNPVHVDPKSPVAKEYALPLATARGAAPESGQTGALFGSGITSSGHASAPASEPAATVSPKTTSAPAVTPTTTGTATGTGTGTTLTVTLPERTQTGSARPPARKQQPHSPSATGSAAVRAVPAAYKVLRSGSGSGLLWMILAAVLVIALGSAGGLALSRRR